jgi:double-stranded uracil-DNA glycosylase
MTYSHPFPPILDQNTHILFLGSFPSIASFEQAFYYAHPRNAFWPIMESIFAVKLESNEAKKTFCLNKGIGLWDVIESCERSNSSDTNLKNCIPNDFEKLLREYPNIQAFAFTGKKSHDLFMKFYKDVSVGKVLLPSTSPAHAAMKFEEKKEVYKSFIEKYITV